MTWRALVLGGGGARGEFQVGALQHLCSRYERFDFHAGVSVGALNVSVLAQHDRLAAGVERLTALWDDVRRDRDVFRTPLLGPWWGAVRSLICREAMAADAIFDSTPLRRLIEREVRWEALAGRANWAIGVTSLDDAAYYLVTNHPDLQRRFGREHPLRSALSLDADDPDGIPAQVTGLVLASATIPLMFPPVEACGHRFVDGGVRNVSPIDAAYDALALASRADGPATRDAEIVVVSCMPERLGERRTTQLDSGYEIVERAVEVMTHEILQDDLRRWGHPSDDARPPGAPAVTRISLRPAGDTGLSTLGFRRHEARRALREHGRTQAENHPKLR